MEVRTGSFNQWQICNSVLYYVYMLCSYVCCVFIIYMYYIYFIDNVLRGKRETARKR